MSTLSHDRFSKAALLLLVIGITALFGWMVRSFFISILMAAIFAGLLAESYDKVLNKMNGKKGNAAAVTLLIFVFAILIPFFGVSALVANQVISMSKSVGPEIKAFLDHPDALAKSFSDNPLLHAVFPDTQELVKVIKDLLDKAMHGFVTGISTFSTGAANFIFQLFIFLFALYYFLIHGQTYLKRILFYLPLKNEEEKILLSKFVKVTRATLKGTIFIGMIQGGLGGLSMLAAGVPNALFFGLVMIVTSIIPTLGTAIVWVPGMIYLLVSDQQIAAIGLALFNVVIVGNIDNVLRPKLVGKSAELPDIMILFGTLGGLALFGIIGIVIGPIIAALFISLWQIYGHVFDDHLEKVEPDEIVDVIQSATEAVDNSMLDDYEQKRDDDKSE